MSDERVVTLDELETKLRGLLKGKYSSLSISFNDFASCYETVAEQMEIEGREDDPSDWISAEDRQKALELNSVWELRWYPDTPIGFCTIKASSLAGVVAALKDTVS